MFEDIKEIFRTKLRKEYESLPIDFATLIRVEIGLLLLEKLGLSEQTVLNIWAITQGIETPIIKVFYQDPTQSHWIANFRMLTRRQTGLLNWENDLKQYACLPIKDRIFDLDSLSTIAGQSVKRTGNATHRLYHYQEVLDGNLPVAKHKLPPAEPGEIAFQVIDRQFFANLPETLVAVAKASITPNRFKARRLGEPITFTYEQFLALASEMDTREVELGFKKLSKWHNRVKKINLRLVEGKKLSKSNMKPLVINGLLHIPGTVNSGKSTLMTIMAYAFAKMNHNLEMPEHRITLIVGDVAEALRLSNYLDQLLCDWGSTPVAVPILGHTQRAKHLQQFHRLVGTGVNEKHWAYRFLNPVCPLYGTIDPEHYHPVLNIPGSEPCNSLFQYKERKDAKGSTTINAIKSCCPLFSICPSQSLYLDLPKAPIWITTPGALGNAKVPPQVDERSLRVWELVYEQSDLVIFDEVDAVQLWFDQLFSPEIILENGRGGGVLHDMNRKVAQVTASEFRSNKSKHRWYQDQNTSVTSAQHILYLVENSSSLEKWLSGQSFTALRLFNKLGDDLSGFSKIQQIQKKDKKAGSHISSVPDVVVKKRAALQKLFMSTLRMLRSREQRPDEKFAKGLFEIVDSIISHGNSDISPETASFCEKWVREVTSDYGQDELLSSGNLQVLSKKLETALAVAALDQRLHAMIGNWPSVSDLMGLPSDFGIDQQIPEELLGILPLPPLGQTYGFICPEMNVVHKETQASVTQRILNTYEYAAVGRAFIHNFHKLLTDLDGMKGPNVIAFSGTSWLPGSPKWDFGVEPAAVLEPPKSNQQAMQQSLFTFWPQCENDKKTGESKPISVSGEETLRLNLQTLAKRLVSYPDVDHAFLTRELAELKMLSKENPELWHDRERVLLIVNSYDQVKDVANTIAKHASKEIRSAVIGLVRNAENLSDNSYFDLFDPLPRGDVENIRETDAKIVVAPMSAIGRGYNILNANGYAAFGSVCFLIRPMPQPFNMQEIVIELNKHLLDLLKNPLNKKGALRLKKAYASAYDEMIDLHRESSRSWVKAESRMGYQSLDDLSRIELASNTIGVIIQTCGRLLRGGVPFRAHFMDAKWAPTSALKKDDLKDTPNVSLLMAVQIELAKLCKHPVGKVLYGPVAKAMENIIGIK